MRRRAEKRVAAPALLRLAMLLALLATLTTAMPQSAGAAGSNAAAAHAFILADHAFATASAKREGAMRRALTAQRRSLRRQCRAIAAESPQNNRSYEMSYEVAGALWSASYGADSGPIDELLRSVKRLRWSSHALARDARSYASSLHALATLRMPHVCEDLSTWKKGGYGEVPATTKRFDAMVEAIEVIPVPSKLLRRYAPRGDDALLRSTERLQRRLLNFETLVGGKAWYSTVEDLGLSP